jgi:hypothetical protein
MLINSKDDYLSIYKNKCQSLRNATGQRIVFIGDSNIAMGINSEAISESLKTNVVNTAITGNIGLKYIIDDVFSYIREGDIVVVCPSYAQFFGQSNGAPSGELTSVIEQTSWSNLKYLNGTQLLNAFYGIPRVLRTKIFTNLPVKESPDENIMHASGFNKYGDFISHWSWRSLPLEYQPIDGIFDLDFADYFAKSINEIKKKNTLILIPPAIVKSGYNANKIKIEEVTTSLRSRGIEFVVAPEMHVLDDSCSYQGVNHLNKKGVDIFTDKLISEIREVVMKAR